MSVNKQFKHALCGLVATAACLLPASAGQAQYAPLWAEADAEIYESAGYYHHEYEYDEDWWYAYAQGSVNATSSNSYASAWAKTTWDSNGVNVEKSAGYYADNGDDAYAWSDGGYRLPMLTDGPGDPSDDVAITVTFHQIELICYSETSCSTTLEFSFSVNEDVMAEGSATLQGNGSFECAGIYGEEADWTVDMDVDGYYHAAINLPSAEVPDAVPLKEQFDCDLSMKLTMEGSASGGESPPESSDHTELELAEGYSFVPVNPGSEPDPCPPDITGDGQVDVLDLLEILASWGPCP